MTFNDQFPNNRELHVAIKRLNSVYHHRNHSHQSITDLNRPLVTRLGFEFSADSIDDKDAQRKQRDFESVSDPIEDMEEPDENAKERQQLCESPESEQVISESEGADGQATNGNAAVEGYGKHRPEHIEEVVVFIAPLSTIIVIAAGNSLIDGGTFIVIVDINSILIVVIVVMVVVVTVVIALIWHFIFWFHDSRY